MTRTIEPALQRRLVERATAVLAADDRVLAAWLEGSFARATEDAWSDIDLHIIVAEEDFKGLVDQDRTLLETIAPVIGLNRARLPGTHLLITCLEGPVRLDLFIERLSAVAATPRPAAPSVLFDRADVARLVQVDEAANARLVRSRVRALVDEFFTGFMWPARLAGRGERGSLLANAILVLYSIVVPAMLARSSPPDALRAILHNERHLPPDQRAVVDSLAAQIRDAFGGIEGGRMDGAAIRVAHERLVSVVLEQLRLACEAHDIEWPAASEQAAREFFRRELDLAL
ncbi:MAG: nucleotidyltransferase domain-containing protein [Dehalococcoidia bacterium]|jgi:predicted nucleotidyltransferase|nr:nucleotidyltransferase domain-containing protein [Dehalococcoidia bacterium]